DNKPRRDGRRTALILYGPGNLASEEGRCSVKHGTFRMAVSPRKSKLRGAIVKKRIGILTGGGDVAGLNSVIKTVTYRSSENDIEVVGLRRGWEALTHLNLEDPNSRRRYVMPLDREKTRPNHRRRGDPPSHRPPHPGQNTR